jgi:hypothetical protein
MKKIVQCSNSGLDFQRCLDSIQYHDEEGDTVGVRSDGDLLEALRHHGEHQDGKTLRLEIQPCDQWDKTPSSPIPGDSDDIFDAQPEEDWELMAPDRSGIEEFGIDSDPRNLTHNMTISPEVAMAVSVSLRKSANLDAQQKHLPREEHNATAEKGAIEHMFRRGDHALYSRTDSDTDGDTKEKQPEIVTILQVHPDESKSYYTIQRDGGHERQIDGSNLRPTNTTGTIPMVESTTSEPFVSTESKDTAEKMPPMEPEKQLQAYAIAKPKLAAGVPLVSVHTVSTGQASDQTPGSDHTSPGSKPSPLKLPPPTCPPTATANDVPVVDGCGAATEVISHAYAHGRDQSNWLVRELARV